MLKGNSDTQSFLRAYCTHKAHPVLFATNSFNSFLDDECRDIIFKEPVANKAIKNHVIKSEEVPSEGSCRLMCYMDWSPIVCPLI